MATSQCPPATLLGFSDEVGLFAALHMSAHGTQRPKPMLAGCPQPVEAEIRPPDGNSRFGPIPGIPETWYPSTKWVFGVWPLD
jgi:hypothetical protein